MINHVYALLRNRDGIGGAIEHVAYVPADYRAVPLSPDARRVHAILFGVDADETSVAIRLRQYATILHSTQLAAAVLALVRQGKGVSGENPDYVRRTHAHLHEMGIHDPLLAHLVEELDRTSGPPAG